MSAFSFNLASMRNLTLLIFISVFFLNCKKNENDSFFEINLDSPENRKYVNESDFFEDLYLYKDTLHLYVNIAECGEWGGPREYIEIYNNSDESFILDYKKYKFNCDSIPKYYGNDSILDLKKEKILSKNDKKYLSRFFTDLMKAKINEVHMSNAGSLFLLNNTDSTMILEVITDKTDIGDKFQSLKKKLNLN